MLLTLKWTFRPLRVQLLVIRCHSNCQQEHKIICAVHLAHVYSLLEENVFLHCSLETKIPEASQPSTEKFSSMIFHTSFPKDLKWISLYISKVHFQNCLVEYLTRDTCIHSPVEKHTSSNVQMWSSNPHDYTGTLLYIVTELFNRYLTHHQSPWSFPSWLPPRLSSFHNPPPPLCPHRPLRLVPRPAGDSVNTSPPRFRSPDMSRRCTDSIHAHGTSDSGQPPWTCTSLCTSSRTCTVTWKPQCSSTSHHCLSALEIYNIKHAWEGCQQN